jgi:hypothetical protein
MLVGLRSVSVYLICCLTCCRVGAPPTHSGDAKYGQYAWSLEGEIGKGARGNLPC